jgi:hypothetical protein
MTQTMQTDREPISEEEKLRLGELGGLEVDYFTLAGLTDREKEILHWRFVIGLPAGGVGQLFSVTRERIRQIQTKAVSKLVRYCDITFIVSPKISFTRRESKESNKQFAGESKFNKNLFRRVDELGLSTRSVNCLKWGNGGFLGNDNIVYIAELVVRDERELLRIKNFGRKSLNEIKETLAPLGLRLGMDLSDWASSGEPLLESEHEEWAKLMIKRNFPKGNYTEKQDV